MIVIHDNIYITFIMSAFNNFISSLSSPHTGDEENRQSEGPEESNELTFDRIKSELETRHNLKVRWYTDLFIITYPKRGSTASQSVDYTDPIVQQCRGLIVNKNKPFNVVCKGFDMLVDSDGVPEDILTQDTTSVTATIDGSYIRVYFNNETNRWCIATNRCIEAKKARWHSYRTFYDYFQDAAKSPDSLLDFSKLNKEHVYLFVMCHPENRIVAIHEKPMLYHIGTIDMTTDGKFKELEEDIGVPKPAEVDKGFFESLQAMKDHVDGLDWQNPGYVIRWIEQDGTVRRAKIRNKKYEYINSLRGNKRNPVEHYLDLRNTRERAEEFKEFTKYFPEYSVIEDQLNMCTRYLHQLYMAYYVHHTIQYIPDRISWRLLGELHTRYVRTREATTLETVREHLSSMPHADLAKLITNSQ